MMASLFNVSSPGGFAASDAGAAPDVVAVIVVGEPTAAWSAAAIGQGSDAPIPKAMIMEQRIRERELRCIFKVLIGYLWVIRYSLIVEGFRLLSPARQGK